MSWMSDKDIAKNVAVQNSIDNLSRCVRFYAERYWMLQAVNRLLGKDLMYPNPASDIRLSIHYLKQRARVAKRYGRVEDKVWL
jgi:hypothetical protein